MFERCSTLFAHDNCFTDFTADKISNPNPSIAFSLLEVIRFVAICSLWCDMTKERNPFRECEANLHSYRKTWLVLKRKTLLKATHSDSA